MPPAPTTPPVVNENILNAIQEATEPGPGLVGLVADALDGGRPGALNAVAQVLETGEPLPVEIVLSALRTMPVGASEPAATERLTRALVRSATTGPDGRSRHDEIHAQAVARQPEAMRRVRLIAAERPTSSDGVRRRFRALRLLALAPSRDNAAVLVAVLAAPADVDAEPDTDARAQVRSALQRLLGRPDFDDAQILAEMRKRLAFGELGWWAAIRAADGERIAALERERLQISQRLAQELEAAYSRFELLTLSQDERDALTEHLQDPESTIKHIALARVLRRARDTSALDTTIQELIWDLVASPEPSIAQQAMKALDELGADSIGPRLADRFSIAWPSDETTTLTALQIVGRRGTIESVGQIRDRLDADAPAVRAAAADAIFNLASRTPLARELRTSLVEQLLNRVPTPVAGGASPPPFPNDAALARLTVRLVEDTELDPYTSWLGAPASPAVSRAVAEAFAARGTLEPLIARADVEVVRNVVLPALGREPDSLSAILPLIRLKPSRNDPSGLAIWQAATDQIFGRMSTSAFITWDDTVVKSSAWNTAQRETMLIAALRSGPANDSRAPIVARLVQLRLDAGDVPGAVAALDSIDAAEHAHPDLVNVALRTRLLDGGFDAARRLGVDITGWLEVLQSLADVTDATDIAQRTAIADAIIANAEEPLSEAALAMITPYASPPPAEVGPPEDDPKNESGGQADGAPPPAR
ncbi:MAG: hypothetical protein AB8G96_06515 [Phycisphaerales bacterium]